MNQVTDLVDRQIRGQIAGVWIGPEADEFVLQRRAMTSDVTDDGDPSRLYCCAAHDVLEPAHSSGSV